jgi:hypothetical protein
MGPLVGLIWLRIRTIAGYFEHGNETLDSRKYEEFID